VTLAPGLHTDIPEALYHADALLDAPTLSSTVARLMLRSPLHGWTAHPRLNPDYEPKDSAAFDVGRAAHRAVLGRSGDYVAIPDDLLSEDGAIRSKAAREWVAEARAKGRTPLKAPVVERIDAIASAVRSRLSAMGIRLDADRSEITALAEVDGVWCRARFDNLPERGTVFYDLKTITDASADAVIRAVESYGYDLQVAHYQAVLEAATGQRRRARLIFVEKDPPHEVAVVELVDDPSAESDWMAAARSKAAEARRLWAECLRTGVWPGYPAAVQIIGARGWEQARWEQRMAERADPPKPSKPALRAAYDAQAPWGMTP
jgi:hypothetical protein